MNTINVTIRMDSDTKQEFDVFCENVGISFTTAINMFVKATLRTRELPFSVTDIESPIAVRKAFLEAFQASQQQSVINGTDTMSMDDINAEITAYRHERKAKSSTQR